jgi:hypothetical protein
VPDTGLCFLRLRLTAASDRSSLDTIAATATQIVEGWSGTERILSRRSRKDAYVSTHTFWAIIYFIHCGRAR